MDAAGDPRPHPGKEGRRDTCQTRRTPGPPARWGPPGGGVGAEVGVGGVVLPAARGEPGASAVPEAVEQPRGRLPEDQGLGVADNGRLGFVLGDEERRQEGEEAAWVL